MKFELERGSFGYIKKKKIRQILLVLLMVVAALIMFFTGLLINNNNKANICSVLAMLMVLPAAKFLVTFIVMFPYKGVSKERYDHVKESVPENAILMTDMVITSPDKAMNLDFVIITDNQVIAVIGKQKQDPRYIEDYLKKGLKDNKIEGFTVKIYDEYEQFEKNIPTKTFEPTNAQDECFRFIRTLVV